MSAWIEIEKEALEIVKAKVALYMSAWIEIVQRAESKYRRQSHST